MENKINLEEILDFHIGLSSSIPPAKHFYINAMKEACRQTLELAAEKAMTFLETKGEECSAFHSIEVNKQSILDVINLIE